MAKAKTDTYILDVTIMARPTHNNSHITRYYYLVLLVLLLLSIQYCINNATSLN